MTTRAPSAASRRAQAAPMPLAPPVTSATRPSNRPKTFLPLLSGDASAPRFPPEPTRWGLGHSPLARSGDGRGVILGQAPHDCTKGRTAMKAIRIERTGGPEVLEYVDIDLPPAGPGEVRVRHTVIGVNF